MRTERFQAKGETIAQDTGLQCQGGTGRAGPAVHVEAAGGPAPESVALAVEDDRVLERRGRDVRLAGSAHDAGLGHQKHTVDGQVKAVAADDDQPGGRADGAGLAEFQLHGRAQPNHIAVAKHGLVGHGFAIDERGMVGLEHVALAAANQGRVIAREIAHQRDVGWAVRSSPTKDDPLIQADQIASHGIDPKQESALGAGRLGSGQRPGRGRVAGRNRADAGW